MDKRKLIGTIIGIIMFAALIVGATYAWLTFTANVINATANGTTLTYWVDYEKGENITDLPILTSATPDNTSTATITAQRPEGSIADNIKIYLTTGTTTNNIYKAVRYVICENVCQTFDTNDIKSITDTAKQLMFSGKLNEENDNDPPYPVHTYTVYFWLDAATLTNEDVGKTFEAYIHAESTQDETTYG